MKSQRQKRQEIDWCRLDCSGVDWIIDEWNEGQRGGKGRDGDGKEERNEKGRRKGGNNDIQWQQFQSSHLLLMYVWCSVVVWYGVMKGDVLLSSRIRINGFNSAPSDGFNQSHIHTYTLICTDTVILEINLMNDGMLLGVMSLQFSRPIVTKTRQNKTEAALCAVYTIM